MANMTGKEAALHGLQQYREELLDQLREVDRSIRKIGGDLRDTGTKESNAAPNIAGASDIGPQQMVEKYLSDFPRRSFRPRLLAKQIVADGYVPSNPKVWPTQVTNCLKRAVGKGLAKETTKEDGRKRYRSSLEPESQQNDNDNETEIDQIDSNERPSDGH